MPRPSGRGGCGFARPARGDFQQLSNNVAVAGQLTYGPPMLPGFNGSISAYYTPNVTPRGAYGRWVRAHYSRNRVAPLRVRR